MKDNQFSQDSYESSELRAHHTRSFVQSRGDATEAQEACCSCLKKKGQMQLKAHGVQGAESQRYCELAGVTASYQFTGVGVGRRV